MAIYFEVDYSSCKEEFRDVTTRGKLLDAFKKKQVGLASAMAVVLLIIIIIVTLIQQFVFKDEKDDSDAKRVRRAKKRLEKRGKA